MQYLYFSSGVLILFIMALIAGKKSRNLADGLLFAWLLVILANLATFFILTPAAPAAPTLQRSLILFSEASLFLHGPLLWLYTNSLTKPFFRLRPLYLLHLIPFTLAMTCLLIPAPAPDIQIFRQWLLVCKLISMLGYIMAALRQQRRYRQSIPEIFSNTEAKYLGWLHLLSWGMLALWLLATGNILAGHLAASPPPLYDNALPGIATSLFVLIMCYFAIRQVPIIFARQIPESMGVPIPGRLYNTPDGPHNSSANLANNPLPANTPLDKIDTGPASSTTSPTAAHALADHSTATPSIDRPSSIEEGSITSAPPPEKYRKSGLSLGQSKLLHQRLLELMGTEHPYLDADLTLFSLAGTLNWSPNHLSQVINMHEGANFFDFVNRYRIEAMKKKIRSRQYEHLTLLSIAYECGFNSKAAFNRAFRKITGMTPSAFKREQA